MPSIVGKVTSYDLTTGVIVNMDEAIYLYSPEELPLLTGMGSDGLSVLAQGTVDQIEFSWLDEDNLAPRSALNGVVATTDTFITLTTGDQARFSTGDILLVRKAAATETMRVTGYGVSVDTLLVSRAWSGVATNYASLAVVIGLGTGLAEGSDPENFRSRDTNKRTNATQIFGPTKISMSGTNRIVPRYGIPDQWAHQLHHRMFENAQSREQAFLYGAFVDSTTIKIRTTGGLNYWLTTNTDSTSTQLTILKIQTNMQACYNQGGLPDRLIANPASLVDLNNIGDTTIVRQTLDDPLRGRVRTAFVETEFGSLPIVRDRWSHTFDAWLIKRDGVKRRILRPMQFQPLAKTGDADNAQIVCEEGLQVKGERHQCHLNALVY